VGALPCPIATVSGGPARNSIATVMPPPCARTRGRRLQRLRLRFACQGKGDGAATYLLKVHSRRGTEANSAANAAPASSAPYQQGQLHKADLRAVANHELLIQAFRLLFVDQKEEPVALERLQRFFELRFPLNNAVFLQAVLWALAVQDALSICRLHQSVENLLVLLAVEVLHLLVHALANQLTHADSLRRELQRQLMID